MFNVGQDDYSEQLEELHGELLENMGVDVDRLNRLEQQVGSTCSLSGFLILEF